MKNVYKVVINANAILDAILDNALAELDSEHDDHDMDSMNAKQIIIHKDGTVEVTYDRKHTESIGELTFKDTNIVQTTCKQCNAVMEIKPLSLDVPLKKADIFCPVCSTQHVRKKFR